MRKFAQADTTQTEFAVHGTRTPTALAARVRTNLELRCRGCFIAE